MRLALAVVLLVLSLPAAAQAPVRFVVAFAPGGIADTVARVVAQKVSEQIGRPVIVENRGGAAGNLAARAVAAAAPDGSAFLVHTAAFAINPSLYRSAGYDPKDFVPVALIASTPEVLAVHPTHRFAGLKEFVQVQKGRPVSYSTAGVGSSSHLTGEYLLRHLAGLDAVHVPYQGGAPAVTAALGNQVTLVITSMPTAVPQIRQGKLHAVAVTSANRTAALPEVPTAIEAGYQLESLSWVGVLAPPGTKPDVAGRMNAEITQAMRQREVRERLEGIGFDPMPGGAEDFAGFLRSEVEKWARLVRAANVKQD